MGARSGNSYLSAMRKLRARVRFGGEWIADPITHPAFLPQGRLIASLYDAQIEHPALMTQRLPDGDRVGWSYAHPASADEVRRRGLMLRAWAEQSAGFSTPDEGSVALAAMAAGREFFSHEGTGFDRNLENYYLAARRHDWCIATTRYAGPQQDREGNDRDRLHFNREADGSVTLSGAAIVSVAGGLAEEVLILPNLPITGISAAIVCAISANAAGVSFDCKPRTDEPGTLDCRLICQGVAISPPHIFLCSGDVGRARTMSLDTGLSHAAFYRAVLREIVRARVRQAPSPETSQEAALFLRRREIVDEADAYLREAEQRSAPDRWGQYVPENKFVQRASAALSRLNQVE